MAKKRLGCKLTGFWTNLKSWSPTIWKLDKWPTFCHKPFEMQTKMSRFWMVRFSNGWDDSYSHCKSPTIWKPDHIKSNLLKLRISDPQCGPVFGFPPHVSLVKIEITWFSRTLTCLVWDASSSSSSSILLNSVCMKSLSMWIFWETKRSFSIIQLI